MAYANCELLTHQIPVKLFTPNTIASPSLSRCAYLRSAAIAIRRGRPSGGGDRRIRRPIGLPDKFRKESDAFTQRRLVSIGVTDFGFEF